MSTITDADVKLVTARFAEACLRPEVWPEAMAAVATACNAPNAFAHIAGPGVIRTIASTGSEGIEAETRQAGFNWLSVSKRFSRAMSLTLGGVKGPITSTMCFTPTEVARDPYEQEFARPHGISNWIGKLMANSGSTGFVITAERGNPGEYSDREREKVALLFDRLSAVCDMALRLKVATAATLISTIEANQQAIALLTPGGRLLMQSGAFAYMLTRDLTIRGGRLSTVERRADDALQSLIAQALAFDQDSGARLQPAILPRNGRPPLIARCLPVAGAARDFLSPVAAVLLIDDPCAEPPRAETLIARAWGLTAAEARIAASLGLGKSLHEIADELRITYESARTRLKRIFDKTGTSRQSELALHIRAVQQASLD